MRLFPMILRDAEDGTGQGAAPAPAAPVPQPSPELMPVPQPAPEAVPVSPVDGALRHLDQFVAEHLSNNAISRDTTIFNRIQGSLNEIRSALGQVKE